MLACDSCGTLPQVRLYPLPNENRKGESLEDFDHMLTCLDLVGCGLQPFDRTLDLVGCGLQSFDHTLQDHTVVG